MRSLCLFLLMLICREAQASDPGEVDEQLVQGEKTDEPQAEPSSDPPPISSSKEAPQPRAALKADDTKAKELSAEEIYARGKAAYARGEYASALEDFAEVHRRTNHPALLFNMAQARRLSGSEHCVQASRLYQSYLEEDAEASNRLEVLERIEKLRPCVETKLHEEALAARGPQQESVQRRPRAPIAKILTFAGGAATVVGAGLVGAAHIKYRAVRSECPCEPDRFSTWEATELTGYGLLGFGVPTVAVGGVWWWASATPPGSKDDPSKPRAWLVGVRGSF